jgi:hypothetical protein
MAAGTYNRGKALIANGGVDWDTTDIRVLLVTASETFNPDDNFVTDVSANELTGGTYVRKATTRTVVENDTNDRAELTLANVVWTALSATGTPAAMIVYKYNAADGSAELISFHDFTATPTNGGDFTVSFSGTNAILLT